MSIEIITPVGRFIQGDLYTPNTKDFDGAPLVAADKVTPRVEYFMGVAFDKANPEINDLLQLMNSTIVAAWPTIPNVGLFAEGFSSKVHDGDLMTNEHAKGCWVIQFKNGFAPKIYDQSGSKILVQEGAVKRGFYVRIVGDYKTNGHVKKHGMYCNLKMVQLIGYGDEITGGPDPELFQQNETSYIPAGMSSTPVANANSLPAAQQQFQQQPAAQQQPAQQQFQQQPAAQQQFQQEQPGPQATIPDYNFLKPQQ